jgi:hypothetical protein
MIWNVILGLALIIAIVSTPIAIVDQTKRRRARKDHKDSTRFEVKQYIAAWSCVIAVILLVVSIFALGFNSSDVSVYNRSGDLVAMKQQQRDDLAKVIKDELSTDQYAAIMAATPDTDVLIILGNNAATFLVEKTKLLVSLNSELNYMVNNLEQDRINLCAYADNPVTPRLFVSPECPDSIVLKTP